MKRCPRCRTKYDPSYTVSCSNCGALLVDLHQPVEPPAGYEPAGDVQTVGDAGWGQVAPPAPGPRRGRVAAWVIAGLLLAAGLAAALLFDARRDESGVIVDSGMVDVTDARLGDCLSFQEGDTEAEVVYQFEGVPCSQPHGMEVYALVRYEGEGEFPGRVVLETYAKEQCELMFEGFVGAPYDTEPVLDILYFTPEPDGWAQGDRSITCALVAVDGSDLSGSMQGMGMVHFEALTEGCYDLPEGSEGGVYGMHPRDCDGEHEVEVFSAVVEPSGPEAPFDDAALVEFGDATCQAGYERILGAGAGDPELTWSYFYPSEGSWAEGDRSFTCYLHRVDGEDLVGAFSGSAGA